MSTPNTPSIATLKRAVEVAEQIEALQAELAGIFGGSMPVAAPAKAAPAPVVKAAKAGKRTLSPEARAKIVAAQKLRWAKIKAKSPAAPVAAKAPASKGGRKPMSAEAKEKIAAAQRARWAKAKGGVVAAKSPAKAAAPKKTGGITPAGRAKIAAAMKARWAARKKAAGAAKK